jgi:hypothetical protein
MDHEMRNSFVGLVSAFGLESLLPECDTTRCWLQRAAHRHAAACVWAVMEQSVACEIANLLADGEAMPAFQRMTYGAECLGPML